MSKLLRIALAGGVLALAGCESMDPYHRQDVWYPTGASQANLAAQVANPNDLIRGRSDHVNDAARAEMAVTRVRQDKPKTLPNPTLPSASGGGGGGGGGGSGG
jgi:type IV pilus biogenesis protein CpaD/CtpE